MPPTVQSHTTGSPAGRVGVQLFMKLLDSVFQTQSTGDHLESSSATGARPHIGPAGSFWLGSWCEAAGLDTQGRPGAVGVARRAELGLKSFQDECSSFVLSGVPGAGSPLSRLSSRRLEQGRLPRSGVFHLGN